MKATTQQLQNFREKALVYCEKVFSVNRREGTRSEEEGEATQEEADSVWNENI